MATDLQFINKETEHVTFTFIPDEGGKVIPPYGGYFRVFLAEGFLARQQSWGASQFPALHGGVTLSFLGGTATFTTMSRPDEHWTIEGVHLNYPVTPTLPYSGGVVEVEAALYEASVDGPLHVAVDLIGGIAKLFGPPLATAVKLADKVSDGLDKILQATGNEPVLALHDTLTMQSGHLVVIRAPKSKIDGDLVITNRRLHLRKDGRDELLTGLDYLVVGIETETERGNWRFPELDELILAAGNAKIKGHDDVYAELRKEAIARAWNCADFIPADRKRLALLVKEELDDLGQFRAVPGETFSLEKVAPLRLRASADPEIGSVTLDLLLEQ